MTKKVSKPKKLSLKESYNMLRQENMLLRAQLEAQSVLPVVDKEVFTRLLEVVYAHKGGLAAWSRSRNG